jgi:very-short-patch-repair endonuclease
VEKMDEEGREGNHRTLPAVRKQAKVLRSQQTWAEELLWDALRDRRLGGVKFRRQHPIGRFVADFYCVAERLVIEVDGGVHAGQVEEDEVRTRQLESYGYRVLRFSNEDVEGRMEWVLEEIRRACG